MEQFWSVLFFIGHIILFSITKIVYFELRKNIWDFTKKTHKAFLFIIVKMQCQFCKYIFKNFDPDREVNSTWGEKRLKRWSYKKKYFDQLYKEENDKKWWLT